MSRAGKTGIDEYAGEDVSFVSRWSRRKQESKDESKKHESRNPAAVAEQQQHDKQKPAEKVTAVKKTAEKILTDNDMPDIESMTPDSDYTGFLSPGVSEELRKLALRKLFSSDMFNVRDGLDDYDDDFTQFAKLGSTVTADMRHQIELEAQRMAEQLQQEKQQVSVDGHNISEDLAGPDTSAGGTAVDDGSAEDVAHTVMNDRPECRSFQNNAQSDTVDDKPNHIEKTKKSAGAEPVVKHSKQDKSSIQNNS